MDCKNRSNYFGSVWPCAIGFCSIPSQYLSDGSVSKDVSVLWTNAFFPGDPCAAPAVTTNSLSPKHSTYPVLANPPPKMASAFKHHTVSANGISVHVAEVGAGPLVLFVHGFPESWYSWRHQLPVVAAAGFRAVAMSMRGYGGTDKPKAVEWVLREWSVTNVDGFRFPAGRTRLDCSSGMSSRQLPRWARRRQSSWATIASCSFVRRRVF